MSRPRLFLNLEELFLGRDKSLLEHCLHHPDFEEFLKKHQLKMPLNQLVQALTHTSFSHEYQVPHQEQLEFLGDAVLQLILTDELFNRFGQEKEGQLSKLRSAIVNEKSLAIMARGIELDKLILVGKGEFKKNLPEQDVVLADSFEALLGQIYRFHGLEFTKNLFLNWLNTFIPSALSFEFLSHFDSKSKLQELSLAKYKKLPRYSAEAAGAQFEVKLWLNEELVASGIFNSKKGGEKELAELILKKGLI
ncbi:MAG: ribonuclease III [Bacteriovoracaceae bacterium]